MGTGREAAAQDGDAPYGREGPFAVTASRNRDLGLGIWDSQISNPESQIPKFTILRVAGVEQAQPGDLTFVANRQYYSLLRSTRASAVILGPAAPEDSAASEGPAEPEGPAKAGHYVRNVRDVSAPAPYGVLRS